MTTSPHRGSFHGAGLGLRRALLGPLREFRNPPVDFWEVAPENWIGVGGSLGRQFREYTERDTVICHGLSLSIGGPNPLDQTFLLKLRRFLDLHQIPLYSEHLSYTTDDGQLYDLMPIPFTEDAVRHVAARIRQVQDAIGRRMVIENVSYYTPVGAQMREIDFVNAVLAEADCDLLLDVNNIYVNSVNHRYDALEFLHALPARRVAYIHIAGHYDEAPDLLVDTHGADVIPGVWSLLDAAYQHAGVVPTLLERDFNLPPLSEMFAEVAEIRARQQLAAAAQPVRASA